MGKASAHYDATAILDADLGPKPPSGERRDLCKDNLLVIVTKDLQEETSWPSASLHHNLVHTVLDGMGALCATNGGVVPHTKRGLATRIVMTYFRKKKKEKMEQIR